MAELWLWIAQPTYRFTAHNGVRVFDGIPKGEHRRLVAQVDDDVYDHLRRWRWWADPQPHTWYVSRQSHDGGGSLHRIIMEPSAGLVVDHINGDGLDNRRSNLRVVTHQENCLNRHVRGERTTWPRDRWLAEVFAHRPGSTAPRPATVTTYERRRDHDAD